MINNLRTARQENGGFTLVELLIVIVVLGILAGITVFGVASFKSSAEKAACQANAKTITSAAQAYQAATGSLPANVSALVDAKYLADTPSMTSLVVNTLATTGVVTCSA